MVITIDALSEDSLKKAAQAVEKYQDKFIEKNREFVHALLDRGFDVVYQNLNGQGDSEYPEPEQPAKVYMGASGGVMTATLNLRGEDVMFVEFGAGIHYNPTPGGSPHPLGVELGYTIGSYGFGQGSQDHWWYKDDNGDTQLSYGTEATMPLWHADQTIRQEFAQIARQVFRS